MDARYLLSTYYSVLSVLLSALHYSGETTGLSVIVDAGIPAWVWLGALVLAGQLAARPIHYLALATLCLPAACYALVITVGVLDETFTPASLLVVWYLWGGVAAMAFTLPMLRWRYAQVARELAELQRRIDSVSE